VRKLFAIFLLLAVTAASAQTMVKSVTADGRIVYSDHPPADSKVVKTLVADTPADGAASTALPVSAMEQLRRLRALRAAPAPAPTGVVLFSAAWCGYCTQAKAWLAGRGIAYQEVDIDTPDGLALMAQVGGGKGIPLLLADGQSVRGFSPAVYERIFRKRR
jgi:glutaredoxin